MACRPLKEAVKAGARHHPARVNGPARHLAPGAQTLSGVQRSLESRGDEEVEEEEEEDKDPERG